MNPDDIELKDLNKIFEYEKMSRELENCENIEEMREKAKYCVKIYLATLEAFANTGVVLRQ
jgi:hypothetical protein